LDEGEEEEEEEEDVASNIRQAPPLIGGSFSSCSANLSFFARRSTLLWDSSLLCWSWMVENTRSARSPPALSSRLPSPHNRD